jgi:hypothetical protein
VFEFEARRWVLLYVFVHTEVSMKKERRRGGEEEGSRELRTTGGVHPAYIPIVLPWWKRLG